MALVLCNSLRLCRRQSVLKNICSLNATAAKPPESSSKPSETNNLETLLEKHKDKIIFSSYLDSEKLKLGHFKYYLKTIKSISREQKKDLEAKSLPPLPAALKYYVDKRHLLEKATEEKPPKQQSIIHLPFADTHKVELTNECKDDNESNTFSDEKTDYDHSQIKNWMTNYEHFDDSSLEADDASLDKEWGKWYGTPDPSEPISQVPCGGCGALLHCCDPAIPGYLPSEIFSGRKKKELKSIECQRCHFLKEYNIALDISVQPEEYEKLLQSIRYVKALVVLMVDLMDFPCSVWPGVVDVIGTERPIIIVANKVDLLPGDSHGYLKRVRASLANEISKTRLSEANIRHIALVSAKTGYGVEDLVSALFKHWVYKGDVFLAGATNVGKSSLFNALLRSDYCKVQAAELVRRATVSRWPGTTLNMLKFPINRPSGWKIYERTRRLRSEAKLLKMEKEIRREQRLGRQPANSPALIGHIGRTQRDPDLLAENPRRLTTMDERHELFAHSKWLYDTPGVALPDHPLGLLSTEELLLAVPKGALRPQTYYLHQGQSIFIGGLARVDVEACPEPVRLTVFCSERLPLTVTRTRDAAAVYEAFTGSDLLAAPRGGPGRLSRWPGLARAAAARYTGRGPKEAVGDLVLAGVGWLAVTAKAGSEVTLVPWTPNGRGAHRRELSVLPFCVNLKGKRLRDTPAYMIGNAFSGDE